MRIVWSGLLALTSTSSLAQEIQPDWLQVDGFDTPPATAFRISDIRLRDPHVFAPVPLFGCRDFTDQDIPLVPGSSFNAQINAPLNSDSDADGFLDSSTVLLFRPLDLSGTVRRIDVGAAQCSFPAAGTSCVAGVDPPGQSTYATFNAGLCLGALPGTVGTYTPPVPNASAPCFTGPQTGGGFGGAGVTLPLQAVRTASRVVGSNPVTELTPGLVRGFLTEEAANAIILPAELPLIGGQPFSSLLRGGTGNCSTGPSDKDVLDGVPGWWFYFEIRAVPVPYQELPPPLRRPAEGPTRLWW